MADNRKTISSYYPLDRSSYKILHEIGSGVSGVVYKAICLPLDSTIVAIKAIDLERTRANLDDVRREAKVMTLLSHQNVLTAHCSFTVDQHLWVVMPFMAAGSLHSIISSSFPDGLSEPSIAIALKETLLAIRYLHSQGHLHRDIKAGNILVDSDGSVKLADFGVSASIYEPSSSSSSHSLSSLSLSFFNELAGTPYWMAPEVIHSHVGYGFKADIWSFGITAMELAHGRPPLSHLPPSKSLVMRITNRLGLNYEDDNKSKNNTKKTKNKKKFSKAFKDMVASCLSQDPSKRPSAEKLLKHPFFKNCKHPDYLVRHVLKGLPKVEERFKKFIKEDDDDDDDGDDDGKSPPTKNRRISGWNFNEDVLEFDPVFPTDYQSGNIVRQVQFTGEDEKGSSFGSGSNQDGFPSPSFSSASSGNSRGKGCCDGEKNDIKKSKNNDNDDAKGNDNQQHPKRAEAEKVEGEARLVSNGRTALPEAMVPSLLSLLSSLRLEQQMVMNVLESCVGGGVDGWRRTLMNGGEEEEREKKALMEMVPRLQQSVDSLNVQLHNEMRKNSALEQELKALKLKVRTKECMPTKSCGDGDGNMN